MKRSLCAFVLLVAMTLAFANPWGQATARAEEPKPVSQEFEAVQMCSADPRHLLITAHGDAPDLRLEYQDNVDDIQAGNELKIPYTGGTLTVKVYVKDVEKNSTTITMVCDRPSKPAAVVKTDPEQVKSCQAGVQTRNKVTTTDWKWDDESWAWIKDEPVVTYTDYVFVRELTSAEKAELGCTTPPEPKKVTLKVQVDKYSTSTNRLLKAAAGYDNDGLLRRGEDRRHYGHSTWEIVTVSGTTETTKSEWIAKINGATKRLPDLKSSKHWTVKAIKARGVKSITQAWVISGDGKPTAWYAGHTKTGAGQRHSFSNR